MRCLMDIRDEELRRETERFHQPRDPSEFRRMKCRCDVDPVEPPREPGESGCVCPRCDARCKECNGFFAIKAEACFYKTLARARDLIMRGVYFRKHPPGFIRMSEDEIAALVEKVSGEEPGHWSRQYVDPGPPVSVYGVVVIPDKRRA